MWDSRRVAFPLSLLTSRSKDTSLSSTYQLIGVDLEASHRFMFTSSSKRWRNSSRANYQHTHGAAINLTESFPQFCVWQKWWRLSSFLDHVHVFVFVSVASGSKYCKPVSSSDLLQNQTVLVLSTGSLVWGFSCQLYYLKLVKQPSLLKMTFV